MAISSSKNALRSLLRPLLAFQWFDRALAETGAQTQFNAHMGSTSVLERGKIDMSNWTKLDSRTLGISRSRISVPSLIVLKILREAGFDAYLVGGCVRDLLLNKVPKDFDVITTATLKRIKMEFHRCEIVGRRFPICLVHIKGSVVEVSSFETAGHTSKEKEKDIFSQMPHGCDRKDFVRWRDCRHRDFTINSLFFDPFAHKIYDYVGGMMDLRSLKLRTLIPAQLSFEEDCARILRGLRIAARLGLSFSRETEIAIRKLSSATTRLAKSRIMMELNYMLSYGAAEPSLCLLRRFNLLDPLLPFHAAYLAQQACTTCCQSSVMLMKLFSNLDKLVTCDQPSGCSLWVGLLAFHMALVNHPQDALVVWTFASVLYHGTWEEGFKFVSRDVEHAQSLTSFVPEFSEPCKFMSDDELAERVTQLASLVIDSVDALTDTDILLQKMSRFPDCPCSGLVFVPRKTGKDTAELFSILHGVKCHNIGRENSNINYNLLGKGDVQETRFVLGKIILDTLNSGVSDESNVGEEKDHLHKAVPGQKDEVFVGKENKKRNLSPRNTNQHQEGAKRQKFIGTMCNFSENGKVEKQKPVTNKEFKKNAKKKPAKLENNEFPEWVTKHQNKVKKDRGFKEEKQQRVENIKDREKIEKPSKVVKGKLTESSEEVCIAQLKPVDKSQLPWDGIKHKEVVPENEKQHLHPEKGITESQKKEKHNQDLSDNTPKKAALSSLFK